jgi:hypothetical protein
VDVTSASAILSAPDITSSHGVPVNRIGASLVILALKTAMVDEEFHINNLGKEIGVGVRMSSFVGWELRATLAGLLEDFNLSRPGVGLDQ